MTQSEFKEILETIEEGLYGKWLVNFLNDNLPNEVNIPLWVESNRNYDLIDSAFIWCNTKEGFYFWEQIEDQLIIEREKRNLD